MSAISFGIPVHLDHEEAAWHLTHFKGIESNHPRLQLTRSLHYCSGGCPILIKLCGINLDPRNAHKWRAVWWGGLT
ncbi:hypothetical protein PSCICM_11340 [Pseudomonas cichorii]|uniref:Uncharacterized protein n=1 Tax=Pseudomonas cichorii TaxID=36746 RepID=A0ABQ1DS54_PSECI|nr:hypothetical protein PSCICM_11340 [Pseudomonas cichorii]GFM93738.1 hypothetical protein PSCICP_37100 [Pseudomonas cichorii]